MHGYVYNPMFQSLAGAGYAVVLLNPRGSNGYGQVCLLPLLPAFG
jgi:dipeptidyl aminopeptidase/acylaminoacyl peptidase